MKGKNAKILLFLVPSILLLTVFVYYPVICNIGYIFFNMSSFSTSKQFIGLGNYKSMLNDIVIRTAIKNNLIYMFWSLVFQVGVALLTALVLESGIIKRGKTFFRSLFFIPSIISITVVGALFTFIYQPDIGLLNSFLRTLGLGSLTHGWLGNSKTALYAIIAMSQWQYTGYTTMLLIVAIQRISGSILESAKLDGCSFWQQARYIIIPNIKDSISIVIIITINWAMQVFNEIQVMTAGGPGNSTQTLGNYMYTAAWSYDKFGYASAIGNLILVITVILSYIQLKKNSFVDN